MSNQHVSATVTAVARGILCDETWKCIGYGERPKIGKLLARFRPRWKNELEDRIIQEFLMTSVAAHVNANILPEADVPGVVRHFTDNKLALESLGYTTSATAQRLLAEGIALYRATPAMEWRHLIRKRMGITTIPDKALQSRMWLGADQYSEAMTYWVVQNKKST